MNKYKLLLALSLIVLFYSCKKDLKDLLPPVETEQPRPVGQPVGDAWIAIVGPEGGVVESGDGRIQIEIPQGALTEETEIQIQPLENTATGGIGASYRLTPHGKIFRRNVTIRFRYDKDESRLSSRQALEIVYQNDEGVWVCKGNTTNDTEQHLVSVQTDHFSDWGLIPSMELTPVVKTLGLSESVTLKAIRYVHPVNDDDFLVPLTIPDAATGEPIKLEQKYIVKWTLNGPGKLDVKGSEAVYTAPAAKPQNTTATITVELNVHGKQVLLISTIYLIEEGISISIDNGPWRTWPGMATAMMEWQHYTMGSLRIAQDIPQIVFIWVTGDFENSEGVFNWNMLDGEDDQVVFEYAEPDLSHTYVATFEDGSDVYNSPGFVSVEEIQEGGKKFITGVFAIDKAGRIDNSQGKQVSLHGIKGTFKVQRNW